MGCRRAQSAKRVRATETNRVYDEFDRLCSVYKHGTLDEARRSQEEALRLIEDSSLEPRFKSHALYFTYARLYVLENAAGNRAAADVDFLKAKYWYVQEDELKGDSVDRVAAHVKLFTPDICFHIANVFGAHEDRYKDPAFMTRRAASTLPTQKKPE